MKAKPKSVWREIKEALAEGTVEARSLAGSFTDRLKPVWRTRIALAARLAAVVGIVVAFAAAITIYALGWENRFTRAVGRVVPYPAAVSLHGFVSYDAYASEAQQIKVYVKQAGLQLTDRAIAGQAMGQRLNALGVERLAAQKKVSVSAADLSKEYDRIVQAYGGEKKTLEILSQEYGMTKSRYLSLIREQLLRQKTEAAWASDADGLAAAREQASTALQEARDGANFGDLVARYSQGAGVGESGEPALVDVASLPANVALAAAQVKDGELVSRPVESDNSFYVVQRIKTDGDRVMVYVILVKPMDFGTRLSDEVAAARPVRLFWPSR